MYTDYFKETSNAETIENENGFMVYQIFEDECFIKEYYVIPEKRKSSVHIKFFDELAKIAKERGCKYFACSVSTKIKDPETPLIFNLKNGFKIHSIENQRILLTRELGYGRW